LFRGGKARLADVSFGSSRTKRTHLERTDEAKRKIIKPSREQKGKRGKGGSM